MADEQKGPVAAGFGLLLRRQGILWWVFAVNLVCGVLGAAPAAMQLHRSLGNTLAGEKLSRGFDVAMFVELIRLPEVSIMRSAPSSYVFAFLFFVFMLFVTGGILETYRQDRRLSTGDFCATSGAFFWRFVRLMLLSIIPFAIVGMIYQGLDKFSDYAGDKAIADQVGVYLSWFAVLVFLLLALVVRLWFDIAQVRAVVQSERRMWRNLWRALRITWRDFRGLFRIYVCVSLVAWVTLLIGALIWAHLPPTATPLTFVLLELITLTYLATRLWQLSSAMTWYKRHAEMFPADSVDYTTPHPLEMTDPIPPPEPDLPPDRDIELPPADA